MVSVRRYQTRFVLMLPYIEVTLWLTRRLLNREEGTPVSSGSKVYELPELSGRSDEEDHPGAYRGFSSCRLARGQSLPTAYPRQVLFCRLNP
jgi:hypothetical protein